MADFLKSAIDSGAAGDLLSGFSSAGSALGSFAQAGAFGNNAEIDKINAGMYAAMANVDATRAERHGYQIAGAQRAGAGAAGLTLGGSVGEVIAQTARDASYDKALATYKDKTQALDWQLKYKSDKSAQSSSFLGGIFDTVKSVAQIGAGIALL